MAVYNYDWAIEKRDIVKGMMPLFFAQLFGLYFIIVSIIIFLRGRSLMPAVKDLVANRGSVMLFALIELMAGLALIIAYPVVTLDWMGLVALIGWMLFIEGIVYLLMPYSAMQKLMRKFNKPMWIQTGAALSLILGAYLAAIGFGLLS